MKPYRTIAAVLLVLFVSACAAEADPGPERTQTFVAVVTDNYLTLAPTYTIPVPTVTLSPTSPPTATDLPAPTLEPSATPIVFADYRVLGVSYVEGQLMVSVYIPGVAGEYRALLNDQEYRCFFVENTPDTLFCIGKPVEVRSARLTIYPTGQIEPVLTLDVSIPGQPVVEAESTEAPQAPPTEPESPQLVYYCTLKSGYYGDVPAPLEICYETTFSNGETLEKCGFESCAAARNDTNYTCELVEGGCMFTFYSYLP